MSTTREAESDDVAKKIATITTDSPWTRPVSGKFSRKT
jgi:hypothetical protein